MKFHRMNTDYRIIGFGVGIFYTVGIAGHIYPPTLPLMISLTPWVLLVFGLLVLLQVHPGPPARAAIWLGCTYLFTFTLEALGVATGNVFGDYWYGSSLGFQLFDVPLVIGFNWTIIVLAISTEVYRSVRNPLWGSLLAGGGAVLFDWVMEPAAISLDYWHWAQRTIPLQNYLAWFAIAALCSWSFRKLRVHTASRLGAFYVLIQLAFFVVLRISGTRFP